MDKITSTELETRKDYAVASVILVLLFIASKKVIPIYVYALFALGVAFYFFPIRLIIDGKKIHNKYEKSILFITGIIFSTILIFSILSLYVPQSPFFRYTVMVFGFLNLCTMAYYYLKYNSFLFLNFIFLFITSLCV